MASDFTTATYAGLLDLAKHHFKFIRFNEIKDNGRFILWRHDIDCSPHRALHLAKIEYKKKY